MAEKIAIVTAAGKGIGEAIARELNARGYKLALMSTSDASIRLAKELGGIGFQGSVTDIGDMKKLVGETFQHYGRIDVVANNTGRQGGILQKHGVQARPPLDAVKLTYDPDFESDEIIKLPDAAWHDILDLLVLNVVRMCRLVTPLMIGQGGGAIVNISGMESIQPRQLYTASVLRLALHGITKIYADRYGRHGIRMNNVLPGVLENEHTAPEQIRRAIPLNRKGTMAEVAKTVAFLLSEDAGYISGQNILVDGALNRGI